MKTFHVERQRLPHEEAYGQGPIRVEITEDDLDRYIQAGYLVSKKVYSCCVECERACMCNGSCPCK